MTFPSVWPVTAHTDHVGAGSTFVAIKGATVDGVTFIDEAIKKGARTIVVRQGVVLADHLLESARQGQVKIVYVDDCRKALAELSAKAAGFPADKLRLFGVTGTKGKTTTVHILSHILKTDGRAIAFLSTAGNTIGEVEFKAPLTTAQPDYLHQFLKLCLEHGVTDVVIEVAAQAFVLHRVDGLIFDAIIFTNFAREHLEFFESMDDYFKAKCTIFSHLKTGGVAIVNKDDALLAGLSHQNTLFFGTDTSSDIVVKLESAHAPMRGVLYTGFGPVAIESTLIGLFNFYNIAAAGSLAICVGIKPEVVERAVRTFAGVAGRFESYSLRNGAWCVIDSAHNPLSFEAILQSVRPMTDHLIVVFGAGGLRDAGRRPLMGSIVARLADVAFITTDNPRTEDSSEIAKQIISGIEDSAKARFIIELDRWQAIKKAHALSRKGSFILLLGKGTEEYQIIGDQKIPFSERSLIQEML